VELDFFRQLRFDAAVLKDVSKTTQQFQHRRYSEIFDAPLKLRALQVSPSCLTFR
jgi:hypothetical protein